MKIAPLIAEMRRRPERIDPILIHTGQHYDASMNDAFFRDLDIPRPDINLEVGSGTHAEQTGRIMIELERVLDPMKPDWVIVVGDVNSTMAGALVAAKLRIRVAHVEAGLRSRDRTMPEEINRIVTDAVADLLLTPSRDADQNLIDEGIPAERIKLVGNIMIDTLYGSLEQSRASGLTGRLGLQPGAFCVMTLHRPSNVDDRQTLTGIVCAIRDIQEEIPIVFPIHPRTRAKLDEFGLTDLAAAMPRLILTEPLGYLDFLSLYSNSRMVITDSGGIQEETTVLGIPCLTLRNTTERPITLTQGTNRLVGSDPERIKLEAFAVLQGKTAPGQIPELWDGKTAGRILDAIELASGQCEGVVGWGNARLGY
jgi:UDP-N-acetylglucosamine 2-epimerase (non-hydrolysing)